LIGLFACLGKTTVTVGGTMLAGGTGVRLGQVTVASTIGDMLNVGNSANRSVIHNSGLIGVRISVSGQNSLLRNSGEITDKVRLMTGGTTVIRNSGVIDAGGGVAGMPR
jgi:hypothetical protein